MKSKPVANVETLPRRAKHPRRGSWAGAVDRLDVRVADWNGASPISTGVTRR
ncbi:MAG: hypothetical protein ACO3F9_08390 [Burkholderiales bacterium]